MVWGLEYYYYNLYMYMVKIIYALQNAYDAAARGLLASVYHFTNIGYVVEQLEEVCI